MNKKHHITFYELIFLGITLSLIITAGCHHQVIGSPGEKTPSSDIRKIVFTGFKPSAYQGETSTPGYFSEDALITDTALLENKDYMDSGLHALMLEHKGYEFIGPDMAAGALSKIKSSSPGISDIDIMGTLALELKADGVLIGHLYRWKDREGTDYSVNQPASVAFDLSLVDPVNGAVLWKGRFDKTQRSLSENILDIGTFLKGKGKWMTAEGLALSGLEDLVEDLFIFLEKGKEAEN